MSFFVGRRRLLLCGLALISAGSLSASGSFGSKQDRSWKKYRNQEFGYCVDYPSRWRRGDAFDGAGQFFETGAKKFSRPLGAIDFAPITAISEDARALPVDLNQNLEDHLEGLKRFERADRVNILEKRATTFQGYPALYVKDTHYDPMEQTSWISEVLFVNRGGTVYRLELHCQLSEISRFEPVFEYLLGTFQFDCSQ